MRSSLREKNAEIHKVVGWAKRQRAHRPVKSAWTNGGHGAVAPLPTLRLSTIGVRRRANIVPTNYRPAPAQDPSNLNETLSLTR